MKRVRTTALATGLPIAILAIAAQPAFASAPPGTEPPGTDAPGTDAPADAAAPELSGGDTVPEGFTVIVDDTGQIQIAVPEDWTDVETQPEVVGESQVPFIEASTDREAYIDTFEVAGVTYRAIAFTEDTEAVVGSFGLSSGCESEATEEYSDGAFVGHHLTYTGCVGGDAEFHVIAANPENQAFTAVLQIQITGSDEQEMLTTILDSFNMTAATGTTGTTVPAAPASAPEGSTVTLPPTTAPSTAGGSQPAAVEYPPPSGQVPADWTPLVDDTQTVTISVPGAWTDVDTAPVAGEDGSELGFIGASTDIQALRETWDVPGVLLQTLPYEADTAAAVAGDPGDCTDAGVQTYDDGEFVGHLRTYTGCGGGAASNVFLAVNSAVDTSRTLFLIVQLTGDPADAQLLDGLLSSFGLVATGGATTTTAA